MFMQNFLMCSKRFTSFSSFCPSCSPVFLRFFSDMMMGQNLVPLVNIKIACKWMFIHLQMAALIPSHTFRQVFARSLVGGFPVAVVVSAGPTRRRALRGHAPWSQG
jgi:hypothetical protein